VIFIRVTGELKSKAHQICQPATAGNRATG